MMSETSAFPLSCDILVFGGTGDLALHKLLPALYHLHREERLPADTRILALARSQRSQEAYLALAERHCRAQVARADFSVADWQSFATRLDYLAMDASQSADFSRLRQRLKFGHERVLVHYLATAPDLFAPIAQNLKVAGLAGPNTRIVLEKPLGHSLESARAINQAIGQVFDESRVFRIDHYLGKETVQNLLALRFANTLFEPLWRSAYVDHVQISVNETLGVENRGAYYDHAGAMRDMVQNHLLQLLCLVAMEVPVHFDAESVRDEKLKILQALRPIGGLDVQDRTVRGQYGAGRIGGQEVPEGVTASSVSGHEPSGHHVPEAGFPRVEGSGPEQAVRPLVGDLASGGVIDPDVLWSCTTCGACVEQCPVDIEHVDHIVDMRRFQVLIESSFFSGNGKDSSLQASSRAGLHLAQAAGARTVTITQSTFAQNGGAGLQVGFFVAGGDDGEIYNVKVQATTTNGQIKDDKVVFVVRVV